MQPPWCLQHRVPRLSDLSSLKNKQSASRLTSSSRSNDVSDEIGRKYRRRFASLLFPLGALRKYCSSFSFRFGRERERRFFARKDRPKSGLLSIIANAPVAFLRPNERRFDLFFFFVRLFFPSTRPISFGVRIFGDCYVSYIVLLWFIFDRIVVDCLDSKNIHVQS